MKLSLALIVGAALVTGCSSLPMQQVEVRQPLQVCDEALMRRMEQKAVESRVHLYWVNCPSIRREAKTS
jgi:hypothetical protein